MSLLCLRSIFAVFTLFMRDLLFTSAEDIIGCGGFVKLSPYLTNSGDNAIDFDTIKVSLFDSQGIKKYEMKCAPTGYFFLPCSEEGIFTVKVNDQNNRFSFTPAERNVEVRGKHCNRDEDVLFTLSGFRLTGAIEPLDNQYGVHSIRVSIFSADSEQTNPLAVTTTESEFSFGNILPGQYILRPECAEYTFEPTEKVVEVFANNDNSFGNLFKISAFNIKGSVFCPNNLNQLQSMPNLIIQLIQVGSYGKETVINETSTPFGEGYTFVGVKKGDYIIRLKNGILRNDKEAQSNEQFLYLAEYTEFPLTVDGPVNLDVRSHSKYYFNIFGYQRKVVATSPNGSPLKGTSVAIHATPAAPTSTASAAVNFLKKSFFSSQASEDSSTSFPSEWKDLQTSDDGYATFRCVSENGKWSQLLEKKVDFVKDGYSFPQQGFAPCALNSSAPEQASTVVARFVEVKGRAVISSTKNQKREITITQVREADDEQAPFAPQSITTDENGKFSVFLPNGRFEVIAHLTEEEKAKRKSFAYESQVIEVEGAPIGYDNDELVFEQEKFKIVGSVQLLSKDETLEKSIRVKATPISSGSSAAAPMFTSVKKGRFSFFLESSGDVKVEVLESSQESGNEELHRSNLCWKESEIIATVQPKNEGSSDAADSKNPKETVTEMKPFVQTGYEVRVVPSISASTVSIRKARKSSKGSLPPVLDERRTSTSPFAETISFCVPEQSEYLINSSVAAVVAEGVPSDSCGKFEDLPMSIRVDSQSLLNPTESTWPATIKLNPPTFKLFGTIRATRNVNKENWAKNASKEELRTYPLKECPNELSFDIDYRTFSNVIAPNGLEPNNDDFSTELYSAQLNKEKSGEECIYDFAINTKYGKDVDQVITIRHNRSMFDDVMQGYTNTREAEAVPYFLFRRTFADIRVRRPPGLQFDVKKHLTRDTPLTCNKIPIVEAELSSAICGQIDPPLEGATVRFYNATNGSSLYVETEESGRFCFGPFFEKDLINLNAAQFLSASKKGYDIRLVPAENVSHGIVKFEARKLTELSIRAIDEVAYNKSKEAAAILEETSKRERKGIKLPHTKKGKQSKIEESLAVPSLLVSVSSSSGFRANKLTDENGTITLFDLPSGDMFVQAISNEYVCNPPSTMVHLSTDDTAGNEIVLMCKKTKFAAHGSVIMASSLADVAQGKGSADKSEDISSGHTLSAAERRRRGVRISADAKKNEKEEEKPQLNMKELIITVSQRLPDGRLGSTVSVQHLNEDGTFTISGLPASTKFVLTPSLQSSTTAQSAYVFIPASMTIEMPAYGDYNSAVKTHKDIFSGEDEIQLAEEEENEEDKEFYDAQEKEEEFKLISFVCLPSVDSGSVSGALTISAFARNDEEEESMYNLMRQHNIIVELSPDKEATSKKAVQIKAQKFMLPVHPTPPPFFFTGLPLTSYHLTISCPNTNGLSCISSPVAVNLTSPAPSAQSLSLRIMLKRAHNSDESDNAAYTVQDELEFDDAPNDFESDDASSAGLLKRLVFLLVGKDASLDGLAWLIGLILIPSFGVPLVFAIIGSNVGQTFTNLAKPIRRLFKLDDSATRFRKKRF
ncbi:putative nodal modulator protein [Monocercomonoides exilis]|uniref:putative nodal modulator protein n=1 Tax=Monocercomonoides exilis TaxID=2049356 RepID=UPI00355ABA9C|nr:putative nodal modulator protein [Monocercomonoides exilis]|eukprot:MONOS_189.1-p1 / transcript=MONOS_189.1 / gene=MONOS_189 / organism=Monocercomonoides_exilis_PA203 / gene_product=AGAP005856-PA / transcript_product=AGAP005856-PA / location=Mono_scaffold00003:190771-195593(+) / protein_length=1582 / sequence_SO=supercontig / SO=protein_coding / is_pseudo=false